MSEIVECKATNIQISKELPKYRLYSTTTALIIARSSKKSLSTPDGSVCISQKFIQQVAWKSMQRAFFLFYFEQTLIIPLPKVKVIPA